MYLLVRLLCTAIVRSFFKEITVINPERVPLYGPVIFVGNHNNQFMDASMLIALLPRRLRFLIAEKSMHRQLLGSLARFAGCIPVRRQGDQTYAGIGRLFWRRSEKRGESNTGGGSKECPVVVVTSPQPFSAGDLKVATLERLHYSSTGSSGISSSGNSVTSGGSAGSTTCSVVSAVSSETSPPTGECETKILSPQRKQTLIIHGFGTKFAVDLEPGYKIIASNGGTFIVDTITTDTELVAVIVEDVEMQDESDGVTFKVQPKFDQSEVYDAVCDSLKGGDTIGIFPEGGSHDRTTLLPLKPGVAVMALCSVLEGASDVMIVPVGLSYHQADKFQSRATVDIGLPIPVTEELALMYQVNHRGAVDRLLGMVEEAMRSGIVTAQDHKTKDCVKLCSSLFPPERLRLSSERYHSLLHRFSTLFWVFEKEPELTTLKKRINSYSAHLDSYSILDHEVWLLKQSTTGATLSLVERLGAFIVALVMGVPLALLWGPLRLVAYWLAERHRVTALAGSSVKIRATDVLASYKILVLMVLLPTVNVFYGLLFGFLFLSTYTEVVLAVSFCLCVLPYLYYVSLQYVDSLSALTRQLKILIYVIVGKVNVWRDTERELITHRTEMQLLVRAFVEKYGPIVSSSFLESVHHLVPKVVLESDTKRLKQRKDEWSPITTRNYLEQREEIL